MAADGRCCDAELQTGAQLLSRQGRIITIVDLIEEGKVDLVINTPRGRGARTDGYEIRRAAVRRGVPTITTMAAALAAVQAMVSVPQDSISVTCLQDLHKQMHSRARRSRQGGRRKRMREPRHEPAAVGGRLRGEVVENRLVGTYQSLTLGVEGWPGAQSGQFVMLQATRSTCFLLARTA